MISSPIRIAPGPELLLRLLVALIACAAPALAQVPEDAGPYPVGVRSVSFSHPLAGNSTVIADIYYPATSSGSNAPPDVAGGPYPLAGFFHGYFAPPSFYSDLTAHMASYGFVVAAVGTEAGFFQNIVREARDGHALLHWCVEQGADPGSFLHQLPDDGTWSAVGHSNGAAAIFHALEWEPRIDTVVSTEGNWFNLPAVGTFAGSFLSIGSSQDLVAPSGPNARRYYDSAVATRRRAWALVVGGGHNGSLDFPAGVLNSLSHAEQNRLHRRLITGFLRAEVQGEQDLYHHLLGAGAAGEPLELEALYPSPSLWVAPDASSAGSWLLGVAAMPSDQVTVALSPGVLAEGLGLPGLAGRSLFEGAAPSSGLVGVGFGAPAVPPGTGLVLRGLCDGAPGARLTRRARVVVP